MVFFNIGRSLQMALSFNPKILAYDIAKGLFYFSPANLKKYTPQDLKNILSHLNLVQREVRSKQIAQEDVMKIKGKN